MDFMGIRSIPAKSQGSINPAKEMAQSSSAKYEPAINLSKKILKSALIMWALGRVIATKTS